MPTLGGPSAVIFTTMKTDPRVDAYIEKAPPFAQPILREARGRVGKAFPDAEETIKWNVPFFLLADKILASMAAFKKHVKVGVWTGMMPKFVDVSDIADLPPTKDFAQQLKTAALAIDGAMSSRPTKKLAAKAEAKPAPAKKSDAKSAAAKPRVASGAAAKKPSAKAARGDKPPAKVPAKKSATKRAARSTR